MSFERIRMQHEVLDKVIVPNWRLKTRSILERLFKRECVLMRYIPILAEKEIRARFGPKKPLSDEEQHRAFVIMKHLEEGEILGDDLHHLNFIREKVEGPQITAALYAAAIVKPKMSEKQCLEWLKHFDRTDWLGWLELTGKYIYLDQERIQAIKNWCAPQVSPPSSHTSTKTGESSGSIGTFADVRSSSSPS